MLSIIKREITPPFTSPRSVSSPSHTSASFSLSHKLEASTRSEDHTSDELQTTGLSEAKSSKARRLRESYTSGSNSSYQSFTLSKANTSTRSQNTRPSRTTPLVHPFIEALNLLDRAPTGSRGLSSTSGSTEAVATSLIGDRTLPSTVDRRLSSTGTSTEAIGDLPAPDLASYPTRGLRVGGRDLSSSQSSRNKDKSTHSSRLSSARSTQSSDSKALSLEEQLEQIAELVNCDLYTTQRSRHNAQPTESSRRSSARSAQRPVNQDYSLEEDLADIAKLVNAPRETLTRPKVSLPTKLTSPPATASHNKDTLPRAPVHLVKRKPVGSGSSKTRTSSEENPAHITERVIIPKETLPSPKASSTPEEDRTYVAERLNIHKQISSRKPVGPGSKKRTSSEADPTHIAKSVKIPEETLSSRKGSSTPEEDRAYIAEFLNAPKETLPSPKVWDILEEDRAYVTERLNTLKQTLPPAQPLFSRKLTLQPAIEYRSKDHSAHILKETLPVPKVSRSVDSTSRPSVGPYSERNSSRIPKDTLSLPKVSFSGEHTSRPAIGLYSEDNSSRIPKATLPSPKVSLSGELTSRPTTGPHSEFDSSPTPKPLVIRKPVNSGSKGSSYRFLGRHHSLEDTPRISRSASFGTARELRSSALTTYRERTTSLPRLPVPPRAASLGRIQEGEAPRAVLSRPVSISSAEQLRDLLSASAPPLYLDVPRRRNVDIIFPPSAVAALTATNSRRRPSGSKALPAAAPPPPTATPLIYRSASGALRDQLGPKQPVFVPARIDRRRNATASSAMATRGSSSNPFDNPPDHWQGVCPVRVESAMTQPGPVPASANGTSPAAPARAPPPPPVVAAPVPAASAAAVAAATAAAANAAAPAPAAAGPAAPRRRGVFRRVGRALRRLVRGGKKE